MKIEAVHVNQCGIHQKIQELRQLISDVIENEPEFDEDFNLHLWLTGRGMNVKRTEMEIRESVAWRKLNNVSKLADQKNWNSEIVKDIPVFLGICEKSGKPVIVVNCDRADIRLLLQKHGRVKSTEFVIELYAKLERLWFENCLKIKKQYFGGNFEANLKLDLTLPQLTTVTVGSFKDFSMWNARSFDVLQFFLDGARIGKTYFPCMSSSVYLVHLNTFATAIFKIVKPILSSLPFTFDSFDSDVSKWDPQLAQVMAQYKSEKQGQQ